MQHDSHARNLYKRVVSSVISLSIGQQANMQGGGFDLQGTRVQVHLIQIY